MGETSCVNVSMNNHTLSQQYCGYNNGDGSSGYRLFKSHTLYQCEYSSTFKETDGYVGKGYGDLSSGYSFLNSHTIYQCEYSIECK